MCPLLTAIKQPHRILLNSDWNSLSVPQSDAELELAILNWSSYQTDWDTKRLIRLYYLCFSASQVPCTALCTIDFYFSLSSPFLPGRLSFAHLSTSTSIFRALKCPAGQTDAGPDQSGKVIWDASCTQAHTQTHQRYSLTPTPPLLHSGLPASSLIDLHLLYQMDSSLLLSSSTSFLSVWLRKINVPDRARRVCKQFFI